MKPMSLSIRLWLPTIATALLLTTVTVVSSWRTSSALEVEQQEQTEQRDKLELALRWAGLTQANAARTMAGLMSPDPALGGLLKPEMDATSAAISELQKKIDAKADTAAEKASLQTIAKTRAVYIEARNSAAKERSEAALATVRSQLAAYLDAQKAFVDLQQQAAVDLAATVERARHVDLAITAAVLGAVVVLLLFSTLLMTRALLPPMRAVIAAAERIGSGDLSVQLDSNRGDEIGDLQRAISRMAVSLRGIVEAVRSGAESIKVAATEIAEGNAHLSQRTEETASSLEETASTMEQLTTTVRHSSDSAATANQLALNAAQVAQSGGDVVGQVINSMGKIHSSSGRISDIIGVIDGIAFQTNILALNAAVEAARAGEQGRGFAVVASEVRSLAQRSAEAAKEIKNLIGASVTEVDAGSQLVDRAGSTMNEVVGSVKRVADVLGEVSATTREQSHSIAQVNQAVTQLDTMTQQNSALVEQSAAAAASLQDQAHKLAGLVEAFRLQPA
ncbi:MAG: methyl-accepting chemotaxis protein [Methylibium sp.]|nr:methyl-accepting chemotaxis protein [Methylibium sp.]